MTQTRPSNFLREHSLSLAALGVVIVLILLYMRSDPSTVRRLWNFFANILERLRGGRPQGLPGLGWVVAFRRMDPNSKWGQVVGNIVSEWTQILGLVLLTKRLMERGSKEGH